MTENEVNSRYRQREELRRGLIDTKERKRKSGRRKGAERLERVLAVMTGIAAAVAVLAGLVLYLNNYDFSTYSVDAELSLQGLSASKVEAFQSGHVIIGRDSVSYFAEDKILWSVPVVLSDPVFQKEGGYFAIYDRGGYQIHTFDASGELGKAKVSRKISGMDLSAGGVTAVFTESGDSSYISYFDRFGSRISVEVKTSLSQSGYPVDLAVSPDGQKLAVVFYSTDNGVGESRLVCYDFEHGRSATSYIMGEFADYYESDTMLVRVDFFDNSTAVAVGTNGLSFISFHGNGAVAREILSVKEQILSVFRSPSGIGLVTEATGEKRVALYDNYGNEKSSFTTDAEYDKILATDRQVLFLSGGKLRIYNISGKLRYAGELPETPVSVALSGRHGLLVNDGVMLERLTFK